MLLHFDRCERGFDQVYALFLYRRVNLIIVCQAPACPSLRRSWIIWSLLPTVDMKITVSVRVDLSDKVAIDADSLTIRDPYAVVVKEFLAVRILFHDESITPVRA